MREIDFYEYDDDARRLLGQGIELDEVIAELRRIGCPKIGCMDVLSRIAGVSLGEAKLLVHNSPAWDDVKKPDERSAALTGLRASPAFQVRSGILIPFWDNRLRFCVGKR
ncbi:hypothetical protein [Amycolatopsis sp. NPDC003676]